MRRAGLDRLTADVLAEKAGAIQALQTRPGRFETSLEEASFDAWIKYYRQDENSVNNQISYYDKGDVVNFMLDLKIRTDVKRREISGRRDALFVQRILQKRQKLHARRLSESGGNDGWKKSGRFLLEICARARRD